MNPRTAQLLTTEYELPTSAVEEYQQNGHLLLRDIVPQETLPEFRKAILDAHEELLTPSDRLPAKSTYDKAFRLTENLWEINDVVKTHVLSKRYAGIAAKLLGCRDVRVYHDLTFFKEGTGKGGYTPWHQDGHYWPLDTTKCVTIWVPLVDCPVEMGPMSFVSGSHLSRAASHLEITDESDVLIRKLINEEGLKVCPAQDMKAGDATFHSCWTFHAAGVNNSDITREAFAMVYYDADALLPINPPINKRRAANLAKWWPGGTPGDIAATHKNPAVLALNERLSSPSIIDIRALSLGSKNQDKDYEAPLLEGVLQGLSQPYNEKTLPGVLLYDEAGLRLFEKITYQPDYYLTGLEIDVLSAHAAEMAESIPSGSILVELGAGALRKTAILLDALEAQKKSITYYALDLSRPELERTLLEVTGRYHHVQLRGLWGTYDDGRVWLTQLNRNEFPSVTVLWLGSSVGNMTRDEAKEFIEAFGKSLIPGKDNFIIAIDGRDHPADQIRGAYDDRAGVTRGFVLNILNALNDLTKSKSFDIQNFSYRPFYNEIKGRNEAYLFCNQSQPLTLSSEVLSHAPTDAQLPPALLAGEFIRFAYSHKYNDVERKSLYTKAGATIKKEWSPRNGSAYSVSLLSFA